MHADGASPLTAAAPRTWRSEAAALLQLAAPLVGANLLQMAIAAVDVLFVARLGERDLAAATFGAFLFNLLSYALIGLSGAAAPLIAAELSGAPTPYERCDAASAWRCGSSSSAQYR